MITLMQSARSNTLWLLTLLTRSLVFLMYWMKKVAFRNEVLFIIDPDGVVQTVEINADGIGRDASGLIDKIRAAQYVRTHPGEVCPAKWKEGEDTLTPSLDLVGKI